MPIYTTQEKKFSFTSFFAIIKEMTISKGKIINILVLLTIVLFFNFRYFRYDDWSADCHIKLKPSLLELSSVSIKKAIKVLKYAEPVEYKNLCTYVDTINPNMGCGGFGGGCFYTGEMTKKEITISTSRNSSLSATAGIIAHETCHAIQYAENRPLDEPECYAVDDKVFRNLTVY
jgi:hypothetical protein